jgi:hypothetical protein
MTFELHVMRRGPGTLLLGGMALALASCCGAQPDVAVLEPEDRQAGEEPIEIEESDLYRQVGDKLYIQNAANGLSIVDIADPTRPRLLSRAPVVGEAGELYVRDDRAFVILERATQACVRPSGHGAATNWVDDSELVVVDVSAPTSPQVAARYCVTGLPVSSRLVGDFLVLVTSDQRSHVSGRSLVISLDIREPLDACGVRLLELDQASVEIHLSGDALYLAGPVDTDTAQGEAIWRGGVSLPAEGNESGIATRVQRIDLSPQDGALSPRGSLIVTGEPQGRFHMDASGDSFRIVTYDRLARHSELHLIDLTDPDQLEVTASLSGIAPGEQLYATRFAGDLAYVVTFFQTDPLWVIDLSDVAHPRIIGELHVPGWSDFIFPRGDRLLAVGRGDAGRGVGVSLFDVSEPSAPMALEQLEIGATGTTTSEANTDHRAVTVIEPLGGERDLPLLLVPYSTVEPVGPQCRATSHVQLIEIGRSSLLQQGVITQRGDVLRTFLVDEALLSISQGELVSVDITDRRAPLIQGSVQLDSAAAEGSVAASRCFAPTDNMEMMEHHLATDVTCGFPFGCALATPPSMARSWGALALLLLAAGYRLRRGRCKRSARLAARAAGLR